MSYCWMARLCLIATKPIQKRANDTGYLVFNSILALVDFGMESSF